MNGWTTSRPLPVKPWRRGWRVFLGAFGAHKFYLGYTSQGIIMLLVFLFGFILLGVPSMIIGLIAFIEFIIYLTKTDEDFEQTYVVGRKPWF